MTVFCEGREYVVADNRDGRVVAVAHCGRSSSLRFQTCHTSSRHLAPRQQRSLNSNTTHFPPPYLRRPTRLTTVDFPSQLETLAMYSITMVMTAQRHCCLSTQRCGGLPRRWDRQRRGRPTRGGEWPWGAPEAPVFREAYTTTQRQWPTTASQPSPQLARNDRLIRNR